VRDAGLNLVLLGSTLADFEAVECTK
jgi:hypothetical protein